MFFSCLKRPRVFPRLPEDKTMARKGLEAPRGRPPRTPRPPRLCLQPPAPAVLSAWTASPNSQAPGPRLLQLRPECRPSVRPSAAPPQTARAHGRSLAAAGPCQPPATAGEGRVRLAREPCGPPQPCASPGTTPGTQPAPHGRCPREETSGERINRSSAARPSPAPRERRVALRGRAPSSLPWSAVSVCQPEAPAGAEPGAGPALARVYSPRPGLGRPPDRPSFPPGAPGAKPTRARQACP